MQPYVEMQLAVTAYNPVIGHFFSKPEDSLKKKSFYRSVFASLITLTVSCNI